jgi:hypothetical protein
LTIQRVAANAYDLSSQGSPAHLRAELTCGVLRRLDREIFQRDVVGRVNPASKRKIAEIEVDSGEFILGDDTLSASDKLLASGPRRRFGVCALPIPRCIVSARPAGPCLATMIMRGVNFWHNVPRRVESQCFRRGSIDWREAIIGILFLRAAARRQVFFKVQQFLLYPSEVS